jgi:hypothetical protein
MQTGAQVSVGDEQLEQNHHDPKRARDQRHREQSQTAQLDRPSSRPPSRRPDYEVGRPGAFLPDWFCLRAGQLGIHQVLEGIELPAEIQRRRCS